MEQMLLTLTDIAKKNKMRQMVSNLVWKIVQQLASPLQEKDKKDGLHIPPKMDSRQRQGC